MEVYVWHYTLEHLHVQDMFAMLRKEVAVGDEVEGKINLKPPNIDK